MKAKSIPNEEFVKIWQTAESVSDVAEKTGLKNLSCSVKAFRLRSLGIPLKKFRDIYLFDKDKLQGIAKQYAPK